MNFFTKLFKFFIGKKKTSRSNTPSITILMAINKDVNDVNAAENHLRNEASKLSFLHPKVKLVTSINSHDDYSRFCMSELANSFDTDFVLLLQMDAIIAKPEKWTNDFFQYDYIGAPWSFVPGPKNWRIGWLKRHKKDSQNKDLFVGNGGVSLRSHKLCQWVKDNYVYEGHHEDNIICLELRDKIEAAGMKFAPYEIASKFAVEKDVYADQFAVHKWVLRDGNKVMISEASHDSFC